MMSSSGQGRGPTGAGRTGTRNAVQVDAPAIRRGGPRTPKAAETGARLLTLSYALATVLAVLSWSLSRWRNPRPGWPELIFGVVNIPVTASLVSVAMLALTTRALLGRKRVGLAAVIVFQVAGMIIGVFSVTRLASVPALSRWPAHRLLSHGLDALSVAVGVAALVWLWRIRSAFRGHMPRGSWFRLTATLATGAVLTVLLAWGLLNLTDRSSAIEEWRQLLAIIAIGVGDADDRTDTLLQGVLAWIPQLSAALLALTAVAAVVAFLWSARYNAPWTARRELQMRALVSGHGAGDSLGYFATRRDKATIFSADGQAAIAYRVSHGVSLASGDPVGNPLSWADAIDAWRAEARYYGWLPAVLAASEEGARAHVAAGLRPITMGDEAILDPARFSLASTSMTPVRHAAQRARRAGLTVTVRRQHQIAADELAALGQAASRWRRGATDRGFSMALNRVADPADRHILWVAATDADGQLRGLLSFVPWGRHGVSLDLMRRHPEAANGITELMISELLAAALRLGVRRVSLNFCLFRSVYAASERFGAGTLTRLNSSVLGVLDRFWQLERLYRANQKFQPDWRPRYLCYDDTLSLPQVLTAAAAAEGFLPTLQVRRHAAPATLTQAELDELDRLDAADDLDPASLTPRRTDQVRHRLDHLSGLQARGRSAYPLGLPSPDLPLAELTEACWQTSSTQTTITTAGRVRAIRDHGGVVFVDLTDGDRTVQAVVERELCGAAAVQDLRQLVDLGDLLLLYAVVGWSRTGTPSLLTNRWEMLAKAVQPIPYRGLVDPETRLRRRSIDLLVNPEEVELLRIRSAVVRSLRRSLDERGFQEVETPILHTVRGGASARPLRTYINAYGLDLSLRIAPELYLKRLIVGGLGSLYEIGRNFRNEGADATHSPEFTALEAYLPFADYTVMRQLAEDLIKGAATLVHGAPLLPLGDQPQQGNLVLADVSGPWSVVPVVEAVSRAIGVPVNLDTDFDRLLGLARQHGIAIHADMGPGALIEELYAKLVEPNTMQPTFYTDFPAETSPLAAPHRRTPGLVERWDLVVNGMEIATAYSELTDPIEQRRRLTAQSLKAAGGDPEAMQLDHDFLEALEAGMPPTGGLGLGVDRLAMLLTGTTIRDVLAFPFVKPRAGDEQP